MQCYWWHLASSNQPYSSRASYYNDYRYRCSCSHSKDFQSQPKLLILAYRLWKDEKLLVGLSICEWITWPRLLRIRWHHWDLNLDHQIHDALTAGSPHLTKCISSGAAQVIVGDIALKIVVNVGMKFFLCLWSFEILPCQWNCAEDCIIVSGVAKYFIHCWWWCSI